MGCADCYEAVEWYLPIWTTCCVIVGTVGVVLSYEALLRVNEHIGTLGFDTTAGETAANWGLAAGLLGHGVMLAVGFITAGSCREKHFRPHKGETKCTHRCKEWGEALVVLVTLVAYLSMIAWFIVLVTMGILYCITGILVGVCQAPTSEKAEFAEIMNSMQIPLLRLYISSILDYCNCPGEDAEDSGASAMCEGGYELGAVVIGAGDSERPADPMETRYDAKRMFISAVVVMTAQVHAFVLMGTNSAHVHTTVHKHYYGLRSRKTS